MNTDKKQTKLNRIKESLIRYYVALAMVCIIPMALVLTKGDFFIMKIIDQSEALSAIFVFLLFVGSPAVGLIGIIGALKNIINMMIIKEIKRGYLILSVLNILIGVFILGWMTMIIMYGSV